MGPADSGGQPPFTGRSGRAAAREFIRFSKSRENKSPATGSGVLFDAFSPGSQQRWGGQSLVAPAWLSAAGATPGLDGPRRAAPNTHADSGGPAPQGQAAVPGNKPRPVPILIRSRLRGHSKSGGLTSSER